MKTSEMREETQNALKLLTEELVVQRTRSEQLTAKVNGATSEEESIQLYGEIIAGIQSTVDTQNKIIDEFSKEMNFQFDKISGTEKDALEDKIDAFVHDRDELILMIIALEAMRSRFVLSS